SAQTIGMKRSGEDFLDVYAPFGLNDIWGMVARPNRALPLADIYSEKTTRWAGQWPNVKVYPWVGDEKGEAT
ncbi:MAG: nucleotidyltransferase family protein, partial [Rhodospirillaceae bacterium]